MKLLLPIFAAVMLILFNGCIGLYDNTPVFTPSPQPGLSEFELLDQYGAPDFAGYISDQKIYIYKVRKTNYIVLMGVYSGYDLVVTCDDGAVTDVRRAPRSRALSVLYPTPWAVTQ